jgi:ZIP family zinc transporter
MLAAGWRRNRVTWLWILVCLLSVGAAAVGYSIGMFFQSATGALAETFAAGALLVMLTDSMIPEAFQHGRREAGLALVVGFGVALGISVLEVT